MPDDTNDHPSTSASPPDALPPPPTPETQAPSSIPETPPPPVTIPEPVVAADRTALLEKARAFLSSPQVRHEDAFAKRRFLAEKGLSDAEVDALLREVPATPLVPPRSYPQPPPSNLPNLLAGVTRILSWVAGGGVALLLIYFKFIYPRLARSYHARHALRSHHKNLLVKLTQCVEALKTAQAETFAVLPIPEPFKDPAQYEGCHTLDAFVAASKENRDLPRFSLLRCAIEDLVAQDRKPTTEEIFQSLEAKLPWLKAEEGAQFEAQLWETLSTSPVFQRDDDDADGTSVWSCHPATPLPPPPLMASLQTLKDTLPESTLQSGRYQHTLEALSGLTGYISAHTYALPRYSYRFGGAPPNGPSLSEEEEVRKEIKALKGLVLNRRSFMPAIPRPSSVPRHDVAPAA